MKMSALAAALVAPLWLATLALAQTAAPPAQLMSCQVVESTGGEGGEIVYNTKRQPVVGGDVTGIQQSGNDFRVTYGKSRPALGGGAIYILRYGSEPGEALYGRALDGNTGTPGR